jgi:RNA-splicing ligase RtcB
MGQSLVLVHRFKNAGEKKINECKAPDEERINETSWEVSDLKYLINKSDKQNAEDKEYSEKLESYIKNINELIENNILSEDDMEIINKALKDTSSAINHQLPRWKLHNLEKVAKPIFLKVSKNKNATYCTD